MRRLVIRANASAGRLRTPADGYPRCMTIAIVVGFCIVLLILAFLAPRLSRHAERGGKAPMHAGSRGAHKAPGIGKWLAKPFESASKWMGKSGSAGRRGRSKMPL